MMIFRARWAIRAAMCTRWARMVAGRAVACWRLARHPAARVRLCARAVRVSQAALAPKAPEGRWASGPSMISAKHCSVAPLSVLKPCRPAVPRVLHCPVDRALVGAGDRCDHLRGCTPRVAVHRGRIRVLALMDHWEPVCRVGDKSFR